MVTGLARHRLAVATGFDAFIARVMLFLRQFFCGLHGHDTLLHFEKGRMSLQCTSCGYETPGWDLKGTTPQAQRVHPRSRVQISLVDQRRVA